MANQVGQKDSGFSGAVFDLKDSHKENSSVSQAVHSRFSNSDVGRGSSAKIGKPVTYECTDTDPDSFSLETDSFSDDDGYMDERTAEVYRNAKRDYAASGIDHRLLDFFW